MLPVSAIILNGKHRGVMIVDPEDYEAVWRYNWIADAFGGDRSREFYVNALIPELGTRKNLAHFLTGWPRTGHINGDTFDNRRVNLCRVDQGKYKAAMHPWGTKSRFKGVYPEKGRFSAKLQVRGKRRRLGMFDDEEDAARAYDAALAEEHGEYAVTNARLGLYSPPDENRPAPVRKTRKPPVKLECGHTVARYSGTNPALAHCYQCKDWKAVKGSGAS